MSIYKRSRRRGKVLREHGQRLLSLGIYREALICHEQRLAIAKELGDRWREVEVYAHIGNIYESLKNYLEALSYHEQALAIAQELHSPDHEAKALHSLGDCYLALARSQKNLPAEAKSSSSKAEDYYRESLQVYNHIIEVGNDLQAKTSLFE